MLDDIEGLLTENRIFKQRNVDIAVVSQEEAQALGFSGVMVRGSGIAWDLRRAEPYECYDEFDFKIPLGRTATATTAISAGCGRCASRRRSSCRRSRSWTAAAARTCWRAARSPAAAGEMKTSMEALIHHFKLYTEGFHVPAGEVYAAVEAPKGEFGVYLVARRQQQAVQGEAARAGLSAPRGDGPYLQGPHAGGRVGGAGVARHRVRGG